MEPITTKLTIQTMIEIVNKLMDKYPDYKLRVEKDFKETVLNYDAYIKRPKEKRNASFALNLKNEVANHLALSRDFIK